MVWAFIHILVSDQYKTHKHIDIVGYYGFIDKEDFVGTLVEEGSGFKHVGVEPTCFQRCSSV